MERTLAVRIQRFLTSDISGSISEELWQKQIDLNLNSVFRCCRLVLPIMESQGSGAIVNNASITAIRYIGKPQIAYATAKAAVIQYTKVSTL